MKWNTRSGFSLISCLAGTLVLGAGVLLTTPRLSQANTLEAVLTANFGSMACAVVCDQCDPVNKPDEIRIIVVGPYEGNIVGQYDYDCHELEGGCEGRAPCNPFFDDAAEAQLLEALQDGDTDDIRSAINRIGYTATVNVARQAVQVTGCRGDIIAHLPLTAAQVSALSQ